MPRFNVWAFIFTALAAVINAQYVEDTVRPDLEPWVGNWFPHAPFGSSPVAEPESTNTVDIHDREHGVKMGVSSHACDDAKTNLTVDWDFSPFDYTCYSPTSNKFYPDWRIKPILECENIPKHYVAHHECMNKSIIYESPIPTYGTHRPLWPRYGEYKFVPRQRWIHNLEHGGVVMLYHPCANSVEVNRLRHLVTNCLRRHIITPIKFLDSDRLFAWPLQSLLPPSADCYTLPILRGYLPLDAANIICGVDLNGLCIDHANMPTLLTTKLVSKPLALVTWGCRLTMSTVQPSIVMNFIKQHALQGPEKVSRDGQFDLGLRVPAKIVSDLEDSVLCPRH